MWKKILQVFSTMTLSLLIALATAATPASAVNLSNPSISPPGESQSQPKPATTISASDVSQETDLDSAMEILNMFIVPNTEGERRFNEEAANRESASDYLITAGRQFNQFAEDQERSPDSVSSRDMPGYGNWCGPGNSGPGAPINTLDRLCQTHDRCYASRGYFACSCDRELIQGIRNSSFSGFGENAAALAIATWFNSAVCNPGA